MQPLNNSANDDDELVNGQRALIIQLLFVRHFEPARDNVTVDLLFEALRKTKDAETRRKAEQRTH